MNPLSSRSACRLLILKYKYNLNFGLFLFAREREREKKEKLFFRNVRHQQQPHTTLQYNERKLQTQHQWTMTGLSYYYFALGVCIGYLLSVLLAGLGGHSGALHGILSSSSAVAGVWGDPRANMHDAYINSVTMKFNTLEGTVVL